MKRFVFLMLYTVSFLAFAGLTEEERNGFWNDFQIAQKTFQNDLSISIDKRANVFWRMVKIYSNEELKSPLRLTLTESIIKRTSEKELWEKITENKYNEFCALISELLTPPSEVETEEEQEMRDGLAIFLHRAFPAMTTYTFVQLTEPEIWFPMYLRLLTKKNQNDFPKILWITTGYGPQKVITVHLSEEQQKELAFTIKSVAAKETITGIHSNNLIFALDKLIEIFEHCDQISLSGLRILAAALSTSIIDPSYVDKHPRFSLLDKPRYFSHRITNLILKHFPEKQIYGEAGRHYSGLLHDVRALRNKVQASVTRFSRSKRAAIRSCNEILVRYRGLEGLRKTAKYH